MTIASGKVGFLVVIGLLSASLAFAVKGPADVAATPHNLSTNAPLWMLASPNEDEICIFCHTPHGGSLTGPLWNKIDSGQQGSYLHYSSATMSTQVTATRPGANSVSNESLLCLACHDGSLSMYTVMNFSNDTGGQPEDPGQATMRQGTAAIQGPMIGQGTNPDGTTKVSNIDLSDDHPISFSFDAVYSDMYDVTRPKAGQMHDDATAVANGVRFFGAGNMVECSSCHDPHVSYNAAFGGDEAYRPFLITPNTGSALCLACHNK